VCDRNVKDALMDDDALLSLSITNQMAMADDLPASLYFVVTLIRLQEPKLRLRRCGLNAPANQSR
jgi:hypothetical protein